MTIIELIVAMLMAHALADYPLQGDFLANAKDRHSDYNKSITVWPHALTAHSLIHAGAVYFITGAWVLGLLEFVIHWATDFGKCEKWFGFHIDQAIHIACKAIWVLLIVNGIVDAN